MQREYWRDRWHQGEIGFHAADINPSLRRHGAKLAPGAIYVPMCGKSHDLTWLAAQGFAVVGTEWIEQGARDYFAEAKLTPTQAQLGPYQWLAAPAPPAAPTQAATPSPNVSILVGDAFALSQVVPSPTLPRFDSVYDRASLVAIDPARRSEYVDVMHRVLRPGGTVLLVTFCYDQTRMDGPPWSIDDNTVQTLFASRFSIQKLDESSLPVSARMSANGVREITEAAYFLTSILQ